MPNESKRLGSQVRPAASNDFVGRQRRTDDVQNDGPKRLTRRLYQYGRAQRQDSCGADLVRRAPELPVRDHVLVTQLSTIPADNFRHDEVLCLLGQAALLRFTEDLAGYQELLRLARSHDRDHDKPGKLYEVGRDLPPQQRRAVEKAISAIPDDLQQSLEAASAHDDSPSPNGKRHPYSYGQLVVGSILQIGKSKYEELLQPFIAACEGDERALAYGFAFLRWKHKNYANQLAKAVVPMAVSGFEGFFAELLRTWYLLHQQKLTESDKQVKQGKLLAYASIDDQLRFVIDEQIEETLNQPPHVWQTRFRRDDLDLNVEGLGGDWQEFCGALARRNVVIHNDDRVDEKYLERTPWIQPPPEIGTLLGTDEDYAVKVLSVLRAKAEALTVAVLTQLIPHSEYLESLVVNLSYDALRQERWRDVVTMTQTLLDTQPQDHQFHEVRINRWMAKLKLHDDVSDEIASWTPPTGNSRVELGFAALSGNGDGTLIALRKCEKEGLDMRRLTEWPVLDDLAKRDRRVVQEIQRCRRSPSARPPRVQRKRGR